MRTSPDFFGTTTMPAHHGVGSLTFDITPALTTLKLVQRVESTYSSLADVKKEFPTVFSGLGNFGEPYMIKLKDDAKPHALHTPRNVPIPLRGKVLDELKRMESLQVDQGGYFLVLSPPKWSPGRTCP